MTEKIFTTAFYPALIASLIIAKELPSENLDNIVLFITWGIAFLGILALFADQDKKDGFPLHIKLEYSFCVVFIISVVFYGHFVLGALLSIALLGMIAKRTEC